MISTMECLTTPTVSRAALAKLRRMTILVGMVGSNGILLAADELMVQDDISDEKMFDDHEGIRKKRSMLMHMQKETVVPFSDLRY